MTELEELKHAQSYIDKLAKGINPINGKQIPDNDLLNNVKISRCMFYVSNILNSLISQPQNIDSNVKTKDKKPYSINNEDIAKFNYSENGMYVGDISKQLNFFIDLKLMQRLKVDTIYRWLICENYLYEFTDSDSKLTYKKATEKGKINGFIEEQRTSKKGNTYTVIICYKNAQRIVVENANAISSIQT